MNRVIRKRLSTLDKKSATYLKRCLLQATPRTLLEKKNKKDMLKLFNSIIRR